MQANDVWKIVLAAGAVLALLLHTILPRYEWRVVGDNGSVIVVYDRWGNYIQRAVYDAQGRVTPGQPFKPF